MDRPPVASVQERLWLANLLWPKRPKQPEYHRHCSQNRPDQALIYRAYDYTKFVQFSPDHARHSASSYRMSSHSHWLPFRFPASQPQLQVSLFTLILDVSQNNTSFNPV